MKVRLAQEHIDTAIPKNSHRCMFADAVQEALPWATYIHVDIQTIRFTNKDTGVRTLCLTPKRVQQAILDFDAGRTDKLRPFSFTLKKCISRKAGWRASHPNSPKRIGPNQPYKGGKRRIPMPVVHREFGLCLMQDKE